MFGSEFATLKASACSGPAERVGEQRGPDEAAEPRHRGAGGHHRAVREQRRLLVRFVHGRVDGRVGRLVGHLVAAPAGSFWSVGSAPSPARRRWSSGPGLLRRPTGVADPPEQADADRSEEQGATDAEEQPDHIADLRRPDGEGGGRAERRTALVGDDQGHLVDAVLVGARREQDGDPAVGRDLDPGWAVDGEPVVRTRADRDGHRLVELVADRRLEPPARAGQRDRAREPRRAPARAGSRSTPGMRLPTARFSMGLVRA